MLELVVGLGIGIFVYAGLRAFRADRRSALLRIQRYGGAPTNSANGLRSLRVPTAWCNCDLSALRSRPGRIAAASLVGLAFGAALRLEVEKLLLVGVLTGAAGAILPESIHRVRERARRAAIVAALPDSLDLLAVAVQAGLGLDAALSRVVEATRGALADELAHVLAELRLGATRTAAFDALVERTGMPEMTALVRSILQAESLGVPLGEAFATRADEARRTAFLAMEE